MQQNEQKESKQSLTASEQPLTPQEARRNRRGGTEGGLRRKRKREIEAIEKANQFKAFSETGESSQNPANEVDSAGDYRRNFDKQFNLGEKEDPTVGELLKATYETQHISHAAKLAWDRGNAEFETKTDITKLTQEHLDNYEDVSIDDLAHMVGESETLEDLDLRVRQWREESSNYAKMFGDGSSGDMVRGWSLVLGGSLSDPLMLGTSLMTNLGLSYGANAFLKTASAARKAQAAQLMLKVQQRKNWAALAQGGVLGVAEGALDRELRGNETTLTDVGIDMVAGAGISLAGSRIAQRYIKFPQEVYDLQAMRTTRDAGFTPDDMTEGAKKSLDYLQKDGRFMTDDEAREALLKRGQEQELSKLTRKSTGVYTLFSQLAKSDSPKAQAIAKMFLKDQLQGQKGQKQQHALEETYTIMLNRTLGRAAYARKKHYKDYLIEQKESSWETLGFRRKPLDKFKKEVSETLQGAHTDNKAVRAMADEVHEIYAEYLAKAKAKGFKWAENIAEGKYAPRAFVRSKVSKQMLSENKEEFIQRVADNIEGLEGDDAREFAALWMNKITNTKDGQFDYSNIDEFLGDPSSDEFKAFVKELKLKQNRGSGNPSNFKYRIRLKNNAGLSDLLEDNFELVLSRYARTMEGHFTLADEGMTMGSFKRLVDEAKAEISLTDKGLSQDDKEAALDYVYNLFAGNRLVDVNQTYASTVRNLQSVSFARLMQNLGLAQLGDLSGVMTETGYIHTLKHLPLVRDFFRKLTGNNGYALASAMEDFKYAHGYYGDARVLGTVRYDAELDDNGGDRLGYTLDSIRMGVNEVSFFNTVDNYLRSVALDSVFMQWENLARGKAKSLRLEGDRLKGVGLDDKDVLRLSKLLYKYADKTDSGRIKQLNLDDWPDQADVRLFLAANSRMMDNAVQRQAHGDRRGFFGGKDLDPIAGMVLQFRSFIIAAQGSQWLRNAKYADRQMFMSWINGVAAGTLSFAAYVSGKILDGTYDDWRDKDEREDWEVWLTGGIGKSGVFGVMPQIADSGLALAGQDKVFDVRSSGMSSGFGINSSPVGQGFSQAAGLAKKAHNSVVGEDDVDWYREDARNVARLFGNHFIYITFMERLFDFLGVPSKD